MRAPWGSGTPTSWICPIMIGPLVDAMKPPFARAIFAAFDAAATTLGSSIAIGMRQSLPFTRKFTAIPQGVGVPPRAFLDSRVHRVQGHRPRVADGRALRGPQPAEVAGVTPMGNTG